MKKLERKEMKNLKGGKLASLDLGESVTCCIANSDCSGGGSCYYSYPCPFASLMGRCMKVIVS